MATRRTVREVPPLDPALEWMLPFATAEDVTALAAKVTLLAKCDGPGQASVDGASP